MLAAWWLRLKGYRILGQRVRCARGEIDLVARRGRTVAFVEVKRRADRTSAAWAVEERALRRVVAAAGMLAPRYARPDDEIRIDAILNVNGRFPRHVINIWHGCHWPHTRLTGGEGDQGDCRGLPCGGSDEISRAAWRE